MMQLIETIFTDQTLIYALFLMGVSFGLALCLFVLLFFFANSDTYRMLSMSLKFLSIIIALSIIFIAIGYFVSDAFHMGLQEYALAYWISLQGLML